MSKFYVPKRYSTKLAHDGQWFSIFDTDETGTETFYGDFKLIYLDKSSKSYELAIKRVQTKYAAQIRTKKLNAHDSAKIIMCELHLKDWRLPTDSSDPKAKPVPFSMDDAMKFFGMTEVTESGDEIRPTGWILDKLAELASDPSNFAGEANGPSVEEVAGN
jgi:hypothetical protein